MSLQLARLVVGTPLFVEHTCTFKLGKLALIKFKMRLISPESFVSISTREFSLDEDEDCFVSPLLLFSFSLDSMSSDLVSGNRRRGGDGEHGDFLLFVSDLFSPKKFTMQVELFSSGDSIDDSFI